MAEYHVTWPEREVVLEDAAEVMQVLRELDGRYAGEQRSVLVGIDSYGGSLDVGLGLLHVAVMVTTEEEPGYVSCGPSASEEEVTLEFDGEQTPFPASTLISREAALGAAEEFLATDVRPRSLEWLEF